jgi:hypothetical protein
MATVAKNKKRGDENVIFFPLRLLGQLDPRFAKFILW